MRCSKLPTRPPRSSMPDGTKRCPSSVVIATFCWDPSRILRDALGSARPVMCSAHAIGRPSRRPPASQTLTHLDRPQPHHSQFVPPAAPSPDTHFLHSL